MRTPGGRGLVRNLYRHKQRCHLRQFLLPTEQDTRRYPIAACHLRQAGARLYRLLNDPAFVGFTELPPMPLACRRHDRLRAAVSHMTKAMTNAMTKGMT
jgi:hypothetical protein